jgi:hypothetical protein
MSEITASNSHQGANQIEDLRKKQLFHSHAPDSTFSYSSTFNLKHRKLPCVACCHKMIWAFAYFLLSPNLKDLRFDRTASSRRRPFLLEWKGLWWKHSLLGSKSKGEEKGSVTTGWKCRLDSDVWLSTTTTWIDEQQFGLLYLWAYLLLSYTIDYGICLVQLNIIKK